MKEEFAVTEGVSRIEPHPWKRFFARSLDMALYQSVSSVILYLGIGLYPPENNILNLLLQTEVYALISLFLDAVLFALFGTTFGKWIFGIRVLHESGRKLSLREALGRNFLRWIYGDGFGILVYDYVCYFKNYKTYQKGETLPWEDEVRYEFRDQKKARISWFVAATMLIMGFTWWTGCKAVMPRIQGEWTRDAFWENYTNTMTNVFHAPEIFHSDMEFVEDGDVLKEIHIKREGNVLEIGSEMSAVYAVIGMEPGRGAFDCFGLFKIVWDYGRDQVSDFTYKDDWVSIDRTEKECVITIKDAK